MNKILAIVYVAGVVALALPLLAIVVVEGRNGPVKRFLDKLQDV